MAPTPLPATECAEAIRHILRVNLGVVHRDDVGPVFGRLAVLLQELEFDADTHNAWPEAVSAAVCESRGEGYRVRWTHIARGGVDDNRRSARDEPWPGSVVSPGTRKPRAM